MRAIMGFRWGRTRIGDGGRWWRMRWSHEHRSAQNVLLFERFPEPGARHQPDIDVDFCMNRRGEVIEYVTRKYGREQVAQIITFNTMAAKRRSRIAGAR